ncbi:Hypothetical predicted protein [Marmota monax]|uniref:Uncharacterized protein n=1 Tax=Marmota monax TaxID=9995 RepID=A0A5E4AJZ7_MARMO|nr:Hypothetical predicted protein [Marmota monax]
MQWPPLWRRSPPGSKNRRARAHFRDWRKSTDGRIAGTEPGDLNAEGREGARPHVKPVEGVTEAGCTPPPSARPTSPAEAACLSQRTWTKTTAQEPPPANLCRHYYGAPRDPAEPRWRTRGGITWQEVVCERRKWSVREEEVILT